MKMSSEMRTISVHSFDLCRQIVWLRKKGEKWVVLSIYIQFSVFCPVNTLSRGYEIRFVVIVLNTFTYPRGKSKFMVKIELFVFIQCMSD